MSSDRRGSPWTDAPDSVLGAFGFPLGDLVSSCNDDTTGNGDIDVFQVTTGADTIRLDCGPEVANEDDAPTVRIEALKGDPPVVSVTGEFRCIDGIDLNLDEHPSGQPSYTYYVIVRHPPTSTEMSFTVTDVSSIPG